MADKSEQIMRDAPVAKAIVKLAVPTVIGVLASLIYNFTDTYFIGQLDDYSQMAAVSLALPVSLITSALGHIFATGATSYISRALGRGDRDATKNCSSVAFYFTVILGIILTIGMLSFFENILQLMDAKDETYAYTKDYLSIVIGFCMIPLAQTTMQGMIRAKGSTMIATLSSGIGIVANIILDPIFIFVLGMGVKGAAIATIIGNGCSFVFAFIYIIAKGEAITLSPKYFKPNKAMLKDILSIGAPASLSQIIMSVAVLLNNRLLISYGDQIVAASGVAGKAHMALIMVVMGITMGMQPFVGYNYGAKNYKRMLDGMKVTAVVATAICLLFEVFLIFGSRWFILKFQTDPEVVATGELILHYFMISAPILGIQMTLMTYLQATGQAMKAMIVNLSRQCLVYVPLLLLFDFLFGLTGLFLAQPISDVVTMLIAVGFTVRQLIAIEKETKKKADEISL